MELLRLEVAASSSVVPLDDELVARALAIVGSRDTERRAPLLPRRTVQWLDECEARARVLSVELPSTAVLDFLGEAFGALAREELLSATDAGDVVRRIATELRIEPSAAAFAVFRRAITSRHCQALPTVLAAEFIVALMVALGPSDSASLWTMSEPGRTTCIAGAGQAPRSRRLRDAACAALMGVHSTSSRFQSIPIERWDRPFATLVSAGAPGAARPIHSYLSEASTALSSVLERDALFARNEERERTVVAAGERRLTRLGFDLHDGPLQVIVALAEGLRYTRAHVAPLVDAEHRPLIAGCFEDLDAELVALDRQIREIAHAVRPTTAVERPLENALRDEIDALSRASGIETSLGMEGDLAELTDSQKIVIFRVVQEALSNIRKHSDARSTTVQVKGTERVIDVVVSDDGKGFDLTKAVPESRLGLAGVSERVRLLGGDLEIESGPGAGTIVRVSLPRWRPTTSTTAAVYAVNS